MKKIILKYVLPEGTKEKFLKEIYSLDIPMKTRNESGCISYDFYPSYEKDEIVLIECWDNDEALSNHIKETHLIELREIKKKYEIETLSLM